MTRRLRRRLSFCEVLMRRHPRFSVLAAVLLGGALEGCSPKLPAAAPDHDGDGVADAIDRCPGPREDGLDPDPRDGCPKGTP
jgi:hypothetical protein